jgi:hypothetical protein
VATIRKPLTGRLRPKLALERIVVAGSNPAPRSVVDVVGCLSQHPYQRLVPFHSCGDATLAILALDTKTGQACLTESTVIDHIVERVMRPDIVQSLIVECHRHLLDESARQRAAIQERQSSTHDLKLQIGRLVRERENIKAAIREIGPSPDLVSEYKNLDSRVNTLTQELRVPAAPPRMVSIEEVSQLVHARIARLKDMLLADKRSARRAIRMHLGELVLHPDDRNGVPVYRVEGKLNLTIGTDSAPNQNADTSAAA